MNEQLKYVLVQVKTEKGTERFIMAADLVETVMKECGIEEYSILGDEVSLF